MSTLLRIFGWLSKEEKGFGAREKNRQGVSFWGSLPYLPTEPGERKVQVVAEENDKGKFDYEISG